MRLAVRAVRDEQIERASWEAAEIIVKCPVTGKFFPTGFDASPEGFSTSDFASNTSSCPHCNQSHRWGDSEMTLAN